MTGAPAGGASPKLLVTLLAALAAVTLWSVVAPHDYPTWFLEAAPVLAAVPLLALTRRRFPLTSLCYVLIFAHAVILLVGAHYTYARVPAGDLVRDALELRRNPYDRLGHVAQGFVPAIVAREVILRTSPLRRGGWLFFLVTCFCLALSAFYELIEWWVALVADPEHGVAFLATQGDVWDTHWDMLLALCGALGALLLLSGTHDRQLRALEAPAES